MSFLQKDYYELSASTQAQKAASVHEILLPAVDRYIIFC
jgi:hypothetical protein